MRYIVCLALLIIPLAKQPPREEIRTSFQGPFKVVLVQLCWPNQRLNEPNLTHANGASAVYCTGRGRIGVASGSDNNLTSVLKYFLILYSHITRCLAGEGNPRGLGGLQRLTMHAHF